MVQVVVLNRNASVLTDRLAWLRDVSRHQDRYLFRQAVRDVAMWMGYEISKTLPYLSQTIQTPLGVATEWVLKQPPVLIGILRAGMPMVEGLLNAFPKSEVGWIGAFRDYSNHDEFAIETPYWAIPPLDNQTVIIADPMIATGQSMLETLQRISAEAPQRIIVAGLIAATQGITLLQNHFPNIDIFTAAIDDQLDDNAYIVPGLGDAGDLAFGPKK